LPLQQTPPFAFARGFGERGGAETAEIRSQNLLLFANNVIKIQNSSELDEMAGQLYSAAFFVII